MGKRPRHARQQDRPPLLQLNLLPHVVRLQAACDREDWRRLVAKLPPRLDRRATRCNMETLPCICPSLDSPSVVRTTFFRNPCNPYTPARGFAGIFASPKSGPCRHWPTDLFPEGPPEAPGGDHSERFREACRSGIPRPKRSRAATPAGSPVLHLLIRRNRLRCDGFP